MTSLQDGSLPDYGDVVRRYLNEKLPNFRIGRAYLILWFPRSPDLTLCDYYLWEHLNDSVLRERLKPIEKQNTNLGTLLNRSPKYL